MKHSFTINGIESFFKVNMDEMITRCQFSPDSKFFSTFGDVKKIIFVWNFISLLEDKQLALDEEKSITNFALVHELDIVCFSFRIHAQEKLINKFQPNSIITMDKDGMVRIWQENLLKEEMHFYIITTLRIELPPDSIGFPTFQWITIKTSVQKDRSFFNPKEKIVSSLKFSFGVYENESLSVDWLLVLKPGNSLDLFKIKGLRNISNSANYTIEKSFYVIKEDNSNN